MSWFGSADFRTQGTRRLPGSMHLGRCSTLDTGLRSERRRQVSGGHLFCYEVAENGPSLSEKDHPNLTLFEVGVLEFADGAP